MLSRAVPFLLIPFLTTYLTPEDYGIVTIFLVVIGISGAIIGLNTVGAIDRAYFNDSIKNFEQYVGNCFSILLASSFALCIIFFLLGDWLVKWTQIPIFYLYVAIIVCVFQFVFRTLLSILRIKGNAFQYGFLQMLLTAVEFSVTIVLIYYFEQTWDGRIMGRLAGFSAAGLIAFGYLTFKVKINFRINREYLRHALKFGVPLVPHVIGGLALTMTDRIFISNMVGLNATGIYAVAYQLGTVLLILTTSFNTAYVPWLYNSLNTGGVEIKKKIVKYTYGYFALVLALVGVFYFTMLFLSDFLLGEEFEGSKMFLIWALLGFAFNGMYFMVTNFIFYTEKTYLLAGVTFSSIFINIPLNYYLILNNGALGAAQATTILNLFVFVAAWIISSRVYQMPWFNLKSLFR